ncbi:MAG: NADH-quinone oxidoreductase subunit C, partial [Chloroflexi bacterium]|nr:NADH-quinone oxidoreductase subunit C [Chloroflexota bacterium]
MTAALAPGDVARELESALSGTVVEATDGALVVRPQAVLEVAQWLHSRLGFDFLECLTAVDYLQYFEVSYFLLSVSRNQSLVLKARLPGREDLRLPSVTPLWQGADLQEREVYDLFGIYFEGHPHM